MQILIGKTAFKRHSEMLYDITELEEFQVAFSTVCAKERLRLNELEGACQRIHYRLLHSHHFDGNTDFMTIDVEVFCPLEVRLKRTCAGPGVETGAAVLRVPK